MHILLVEDDRMIGEAVREALTDEGYDVLWAKSGWEAGGMLAAGTFDVVFLDMGLPGRDGMALLRDLRTKDTATPVLVMTARDALEDRLAGLDAGADDYVLKPFHMSELLARMRAVLRRKAVNPMVEYDTAAQAAAELTNGIVTLRLDTKTATVTGPAGKEETALSKKEFELLEALLTRPGTILSRQALEERLYPDETPESNALEFILYGLRKKLGAGVIRNIRGLGWMVQKEKAA